MNDPHVELLERALGYTRGALAAVAPSHLNHPTPCVGWSLDQLLDHMDDALDAFTEGVTGTVGLRQQTLPCSLEARVSTLQTKACGLLGAWSGPGAPDVVHVGTLPVDTDVVLGAAALEIAVHGWDVAQATGEARPIPDPLARLLEPVAMVLVDIADRGGLFAAPLDVAARATPGERLLAFLGRSDRLDPTGPPTGYSRIRRTQHRPPS